jgi:hypothetical protein
MEDDPQGLSPKPASQRTRRQRSRFLTETSCARPELRRKSQPFAFDSTRSSDRQASTLWFAWQAATSSAEDDPNRWRDHRQHTIRDVARHRPDIRARIAMTDHGYDNQANRRRHSCAVSHRYLAPRKLRAERRLSPETPLQAPGDHQTDNRQARAVKTRRDTLKKTTSVTER